MTYQESATVRVEVKAGTVEFSSPDGPVAPTAAIEALFGDYRLCATLRTVAAPSSRVMLYRPPHGPTQANLDLVPRHQWLQAAPGLWMAQDGVHLLLAPSDRGVVDSVRRAFGG